MSEINAKDQIGKDEIAFWLRGISANQTLLNAKITTLTEQSNVQGVKTESRFQAIDSRFRQVNSQCKAIATHLIRDDQGQPLQVQAPQYASTTRALAIGEIVEHILLHLPIRDLVQASKQDLRGAS